MREEFLNIWVHSDGQLEELIGRKVRAREKLSHWPLSYVERVTLEDNTQLVYKSQHSAASVEREFYSKIEAPFLASPVYSGEYENCDILVLPYLGCPALAEVPEYRLEQAVLSASRMIQEIPGMPVFFDLSSAEKLARVVDSVCACFDENCVAMLKNWVREKAPVCYANQRVGNVHGDLTAANILIENGEPRYILDWQRPMAAPVGLESALAFRLAGHDAAARYGDLGILALVCHFVWYAYACAKFLPFVFGTAEKLLLEFACRIGGGRI